MFCHLFHQLGFTVLMSEFRQGNSAAFSIAIAEAPLHLNGKSPLMLLREMRLDSPA